MPTTPAGNAFRAYLITAKYLRRVCTRLSFASVEPTATEAWRLHADLIANAIGWASRD